jgi:hypothetical protein
MNDSKVDLFKQLRMTEYAPFKKPTLVEVGEGAYLTVAGAGDPGGDEFERKVGALYGIAYTVKMQRKFSGGRDYVIGKLEGLWWSDEGPDLKNIPKERWRWKLMIRTPDFVAATELETAATKLVEKGKDPEVRNVRLEAFREGPCMQMLHVGPFENEWATISAMLDHAHGLGYEPHGRHHEIYISDPRRVPPERLKTILRMPVRRSS